MRCDWQSYLDLLPLWMRPDVDRLGRNTLQELRLRSGRTPELVTIDGSMLLDRFVTAEDLAFCVNAASQYSPWAASTIGSGFITATGGHRLGICGDVVMTEGSVSTLRSVTSVCLRVARDFPGIGLAATGTKGSTLLIGSPGSGKTTLLRDLIRQKANFGTGAVVVVDERKELFPVQKDLTYCFPPGLRTDVLSGCSKTVGVEMALRTMRPAVIAVDEITAEVDCHALIRAGWCGATLLATAHAGNRRELMTRPVYKPLLDCGLFENLIVIRPDRSWEMERMDI